MRDRPETPASIGERDGKVLTDQNRSSVDDRFGEQILDMSIEDRNNPRLILSAEERTVDWFGRLHRAYGGLPLTIEQRGEIEDFLEERAPDQVAHANADQLVQDLSRVMRDLGGAGLPTDSAMMLQLEIESLGEDVRKEDRYRRRHDAPLVKIMELVKKAKGAWAETHLLKLEPYVSPHRWWLR